MKDTKEQILWTALRLFAENGYAAVSVSQIAGELGMVKSALYRHYPSKQDILRCILARMESLDAQTAAENHMPEDTLSQTPQAYSQARLSDLRQFTQAMFVHWTREEFPALFRRMLTIEQYRSPEMARLYQQYLAQGPLGYLEDLFTELTGADGRFLALRFYAPMYFLYSLYDAEADKADALFAQHIQHFLAEVAAQYHLEAL